jgi:hypothetical protein
MLEEPDPTDADPAGEWYCFEKGATKSTDSEGWAGASASAGNIRANGKTWTPPSLSSNNRRADDDLEDAFAWKEERTLSQALTLQ